MIENPSSLSDRVSNFAERVAADVKAINATLATTVASVTEVSTTASNAQTTANSKVSKTGARGSLAGYEDVTSNNESTLTINQDSPDNIICPVAATVTISNGVEGQVWTKCLIVVSADTSITMEDKWLIGGSNTTLTDYSLVVLKWCSTFGVANLITTG